MVRLSDQPIDPGALLAGFLGGRRETGAVVSFTGLVRGDDGVEALELEAYPGFTEPAIERFIAGAVERFGLDDALAVHRIGRISPGHPVVFVAAAARHRRAAFDGADYLMDHLKSRAPFWKKSHEASGARWIEPTPRDRADLARWKTMETL
jgi:molybdopterin synthase catalytic subunit